jgi:hypothetical protein
LAEYRFVVKPAHERGEEDVPVLEEADFKNRCEMTIEFKKYLEKMCGADENKRAQADKERV